MFSHDAASQAIKKVPFLMGRADPLKSCGISGDRKGEALTVATLCENARFLSTCRQNRLKMERECAPSPNHTQGFVDDLIARPGTCPDGRFFVSHTPLLNASITVTSIGQEQASALRS